jgi:hypothetical protein
MFEVSVWEFQKYSPETLNAVPQLCTNLRTHLLTYPPDFLVTWTIPCDKSMVVSKVTPDGNDTELYVRADAQTLSGMVGELFTALRLFKEGNFFDSGLWSYATGTVNLARQPGEIEVALADEHIHVGTTLSSLTGSRDAPYYIDSAEFASLGAFIDEMFPLLDYLQQRQLSNFDYALDYFNSSYESVALRDKFKNLVVCLEALLLRQSDKITNSLARHVAALIGTSDMDKKKIIKEMNQFYDVRSKLVHGSDLKTKHFSALKDLGRLREIVRRTILGSIVLLTEIGEIGTDKGFYDGLEEMEVNEELRNRVLLRATRFLPRKM